MFDKEVTDACLRQALTASRQARPLNFIELPINMNMECDHENMPARCIARS